MKKSSFIFQILIFFILIQSGCGFVIRPHLSGDVLIVDDFASDRIPWKTWLQPGISSASYLKDGFVLVVETEDMDMLSTTGHILDDVRIEVIGEKIAGSDDNHYGVVCRYQDDFNYYGFSITSDGYYGIYKVKDGIYQLLSSNNLEYSNFINQKENANIIEAVCNKNLLVLAVNGYQLAEATDDTFMSGQTGLVVGTFAEPELAVKFDNFIVTYP